MLMSVRRNDVPREEAMSRRTINGQRAGVQTGT